MAATLHGWMLWGNPEDSNGAWEGHIAPFSAATDRRSVSGLSRLSTGSTGSRRSPNRADRSSVSTSRAASPVRLESLPGSSPSRAGSPDSAMRRPSGRKGTFDSLGEPPPQFGSPGGGRFISGISNVDSTILHEEQSWEATDGPALYPLRAAVLCCGSNAEGQCGQDEAAPTVVEQPVLAPGELPMHLLEGARQDAEDQDWTPELTRV
eukprot:CAMPEP_0174929866 /NCGR_PEP_ID=MMETSP1355-20121228/29167_1 /TAXON_ID=464990 /ORGANISM="Hemiselmis tepida, Strain CCMP443" /LENGTH=207 /DNA_ID=CAMNT_0016176115 /DNA_START=26 /DNA_END=646 /DNA_ORIENTATION=-